MHRTARCAIAALVIALPGLAGAQDVSRVYFEATEAFDNGNYADAIEKLREAIGTRPEPGGRIRRGGAMVVDYTPYVYLALAEAESGDCEAAFEAWEAGGGYSATLGRAGGLGARLVGTHRNCRDTAVAAVREELDQVDDGRASQLATQQYVAARWGVEFEPEYRGITSALADLDTQLSALGDASPANLDAIEAVGDAAEDIRDRYEDLVGRLEVAANTPPPAAEPEPAAPTPQPVDTPPDPEPEAVAESVAEEEVVAEEEAPATTPATTPTPDPSPARRAEPTPPANTPTDPTPVDAAPALRTALTAFFERGDLDAVLRATTDIPAGAAAEQRWQLGVIRAAAQFYRYRLGEDDQGLASATRTLTTAVAAMPGARLDQSLFAPAFVEVFDRAAGR